VSIIGPDIERSLRANPIVELGTTTPELPKLPPPAMTAAA
jgi:hypothetical protein